MNKQQGPGRIEWRQVVGYEGLYEVSSDGRVKRIGGTPKCRQERIRSCPINSRWGYRHVVLHKNGAAKTWRVHVLVALAFLGERPAGADINHINGIKTDNRVENLEYCTRRENLAHARALGLYDKRGEAHHGCKLTEQDVIEIRKAHERGVSGRELAKQYGVRPSQISRIVTGKRWSHVSGAQYPAPQPQQLSLF